MTRTVGVRAGPAPSLMAGGRAWPGRCCSGAALAVAGQTNGERGALPRFAVRQQHVAAHQPAQPLTQGQTKAGALGVFAAAQQFGERLEQLVLLLGRQATPRVAHVQAHPLVGPVALPAHTHRDDAVAGELGSVAEQIRQRLAHPSLVGAQAADVRRAIDDQPVALLGDLGPHAVRKILDPRREVEARRLQGERALDDLLVVEQVVDQAQQVVGGVVDLCQVALLVLVQLRHFQQLDEADDVVQRRAQLVADGGQEEILGDRDVFGLVAGLGQCSVRHFQFASAFLDAPFQFLIALLDLVCHRGKRTGENANLSWVGYWKMDIGPCLRRAACVAFVIPLAVASTGGSRSRRGQPPQERTGRLSRESNSRLSSILAITGSRGDATPR